MTLIEVRAQARDGYEGIFRARRFWPSKDSVLVEVVDQDEDPVPFDTRKIGLRSFAALEKDGRLSIRPGPADDALPREAAPAKKKG